MVSREMVSSDWRPWEAWMLRAVGRSRSRNGLAQASTDSSRAPVCGKTGIGEGNRFAACIEATRISYGDPIPGKRIAAMSTRYQYDLDQNGEWRWIAVAETGEPRAVSPVGYAHLQDCLHAVALMQVPGEFLAQPVRRQVPKGEDPPEKALSRLQRHS
jgi:uncharacterized protein YegP (UPF0339 family)